MRYKILLIGRNEEKKEDLFYELKSNFDVLTCSCVDEDILAHINCMRPDLILICTGKLTSEDYSSFAEIYHEYLKAEKIDIAIIGETMETEEFLAGAGEISELVLNAAFPVFAIKSQIDMYLKKKIGDKEDSTVPDVFSLVRRKVLVVDDSTLMLKVIRETLHDKLDVTVVTSGELALSYLESKTTDVILLDYDMPGMSGTEVFEKLKKNDKTKNIPVIFLTGVSERKKITKALKMGPQGYLLKPINKEKLLGLIAKCVG